MSRRETLAAEMVAAGKFPDLASALAELDRIIAESHHQPAVDPDVMAKRFESGGPIGGNRG